MRKEVMCLSLVFVLIIMSFSFAAADEQDDKIDKAESCLNDKVREVDSLTLEEAIFSTLALGSKSKLNSVINSEKSSSAECWPSSGCTLKRTAQMALAYERINKNNDDIIEWIASKNRSVTGLTWYLQIVTKDNEADNCEVRYDGQNYDISVDEDMKLSGSAGNCLSISPDGYKLKINNNCLDKEFSVSCDLEFKTNLIYEKSSGGTIFISSTTNAASGGGLTSEKITARCLGDTGCDYEGTLWGTAALSAEGEDTDDYVPYLIALAPENTKYFPSSFLNYVTSRDDQYGEIMSLRTGGKWDIEGSPENEFYDTSLAMIGLGGDAKTNPDLKDTATYLLGEGMQTEQGCWNSGNIRDTAFILYAGWGKQLGSGGGGGGGTDIDITEDDICSEVSGTCRTNCTSTEDETLAQCDDDEETCCVEPDDGGYDPDAVTDCELEGYFCGGNFDCLEAGGNVLPVETYTCEVWSDVCCTVNPEESLETCTELDGDACSFEEECDGSEVDSFDGPCCLGSCVESGGEEPIDECEIDDDCASGEECSFGECIEKTDEGRSWTWIIILIILIVLVLLAIVFRSKLRIWWYKMRGKAGSRKIPPSSGPGMMRERVMPRPIPRFGAPVLRRPMPQGQPVRRPMKAVSTKDTEMEETLKKLREMSK